MITTRDMGGDKYPDDWSQRRRKVIRRDGHECVECGSSSNLHVHHIQPISRGGGHELDNLKTVCKDCHEDIHGFSITDPASKKWAEAFEWALLTTAWVFSALVVHPLLILGLPVVWWWYLFHVKDAEIDFEAESTSEESTRQDELTNGELRAEIADVVGGDPSRYGQGSQKTFPKATLDKLVKELRPDDVWLRPERETRPELYRHICKWIGGEYDSEGQVSLKRANLKRLHAVVVDARAPSE